MKNKDLFGKETTDDDYYINKHESSYQRFKRVNNYRKSVDHRKCKSCFSHKKTSYHNINYYKCKLIGFSSGNATDIKAFHVCDKFNNKYLGPLYDKKK